MEIRVPSNIFEKLVCHFKDTIGNDLLQALLEIEPTAKQDAEPGFQMFPKFVSLSMAVSTQIETSTLEESILKKETL